MPPETRGQGSPAGLGLGPTRKTAGARNTSGQPYKMAVGPTARGFPMNLRATQHVTGPTHLAIRPSDRRADGRRLSRIDHGRLAAGQPGGRSRAQDRKGAWLEQQRKALRRDCRSKVRCRPPLRRRLDHRALGQDRSGDLVEVLCPSDAPPASGSAATGPPAYPLAARPRRARGDQAEGRRADGRHQQRPPRHRGSRSSKACRGGRRPGPRLKLPDSKSAAPRRSSLGDCNRDPSQRHHRARPPGRPGSTPGSPGSTHGRAVKFLDIGPAFLDPSGRLVPAIEPDFLHLSRKGYQIWADAMEPTLWETDGSRAITPERFTAGSHA